MNYLHTNEPQIIHHDLKTLNILLTSEISQTNSNEHISIKICDFGLSQIISKDSKTPGLKGIGSVQWMAPETLQVNTLDNINEKVDVYSFGIIIWEIWARTQPYKDMDVSQVINYVVNENGRPDLDLIKKEEMPEGLLGLFELMEKCWNKDPNSRPDCTFLNGVFHPNIDDDGRVCFGSFSWQNNFTILDLLNSLYFNFTVSFYYLLKYPNFGDGYNNKQVAEFYKANPEEYHNVVRDLVKEFHKP